MKKIIILYFLTVLNLQDHAQIQKGIFMLGGNVSYFRNSDRFIDTAKASKNTNKNKSGALNLNFNCGYFFTDNLVAGVFLGANSTSNINESRYNNGTLNLLTQYRSETKNITYSGGAFARYYGMKKENKLRVFAQVSGAYQLGWTITKNIQSNAPDKKEINSISTGYEAGITPGIVYFVTRKIGLETTFGSISYSHRSNTYFSNGSKVNTSTGDYFNTNLSLYAMRFGVYFYFSMK